MMVPRVSGSAAAALALALTIIASSSVQPADGFAVGLRFNHTECFYKVGLLLYKLNAVDP
jgi:hypothetical protein